MAYKSSWENLSNFLKGDVYLSLIVPIHTFKLTLVKVLGYIKILFKEWVKHMTCR